MPCENGNLDIARPANGLGKHSFQNFYFSYDFFFSTVWNGFVLMCDYSHWNTVVNLYVTYKSLAGNFCQLWIFFKFAFWDRTLNSASTCWRKWHNGAKESQRKLMCRIKRKCMSENIKIEVNIHSTLYNVHNMCCWLYFYVISGSSYNCNPFVVVDWGREGERFDHLRRHKNRVRPSIQ